MIRPITCLTVVLACGSGLCLYQSKHRVHVLDDQIAQTVKATQTLGEQTRMLSAEWTLLNDPERLRKLATQYLTLQTVSPSQFTSLADLNSRLPQPLPPGPPASAGPPTGAGAVVPAPPAEVPVASDGSGGSSQSGEDAGKPADAKLAAATQAASPKDSSLKDGSLKDAAPDTAAPKDAAAPAQAASSPAPRIALTAPAPAAHLADRRPPTPRPVQAQTRVAADAQRPPAQHGTAQLGTGQWGPGQRETAQRDSDRRLAEARPIVRVVRVRAPVPMVQSGGSLLGMAHDTAMPPAPIPLPRPLPMNAVQPYSGAGG